MGNTPAEVVSRPWYDFSLGQGFTVGSGGNHDGRDVQTPLHTPLTNLLPGVVTPHTGWYPWGGEVDIQLPNGITETWAHLDAIAVKPGQIVQAGQFIGLSGGDNLPAKYSTGPHTHFSLFSGAPWNNAGAVNPTPLLDWAQSFMGGGPTTPTPNTNPSANPNDIWQQIIQGGMAGTAGLPPAQSGGQTIGQAASQIFSADTLWRGGLVIFGGLLLLAGLIVFILPTPEHAARIAGEFTGGMVGK